MMIKTILIIFLLIMPTIPTHALTIRDAKYLSCYDGDTCMFFFSSWPDFLQRMSVRVRGIDAPEIHGKCLEEKIKAINARNALHFAILTAQTVELRRVTRDKYFRLLAEIWVDGQDVAEILIRKGLVRSYDGGEREGWCGEGGER